MATTAGKEATSAGQAGHLRNAEQPSEMPLDAVSILQTKVCAKVCCLSCLCWGGHWRGQYSRAQGCAIKVAQFCGASAHLQHSCAPAIMLGSCIATGSRCMHYHICIEEECLPRCPRPAQQGANALDLGSVHTSLDLSGAARSWTIAP